MPETFHGILEVVGEDAFSTPTSSSHPSRLPLLPLVFWQAVLHTMDSADRHLIMGCLLLCSPSLHNSMDRCCQAAHLKTQSRPLNFRRGVLPELNLWSLRAPSSWICTPDCNFIIDFVCPFANQS